MKNIRIFFKLCELNAKKLLIYRESFFISLALMSVWVLAYVTLIEVIFHHTRTLSGFSKGEVLIIMSFYYYVQNFSDIFFKDNFEDFGETVRRGELDFKLVKPAPLRLLTFFWEIRFDHAAGLIVTTAMLLYGITLLTEPLSTAFFLLAMSFTIVSLILYFSILCIIASLTFWIERNDSLNALIFNISQLSRYPRQIYRRVVGQIVTFGIPLALIASVPAEIALQFEHGYLALFFIGISAVFYILALALWNIGLKKYTSAN